MARLGPWLSDPVWQDARMKLNALNAGGAVRGLLSPEPTASFGEARLFRKPNGDYELVGGTVADRVAAKEWVSLFMHEASISFRPAPAVSVMRPGRPGPAAQAA
jgi:hypothetical protein